ncbi:uncharacterized protein [Miscanthus floridulus]|uniref:uncharacterized protein n=1 Tax=Miscanthus floridulus TaxID=154761 RepID=UPI0034576204
MDADDWLQTIESKLEIAHCVGHDRVLYAAHQLQGRAKDWWATYTATHPNAQAITWQEFCQSFRSHYVPSGEIKVKRKEFLELKQGSINVDTNDKKQDYFRDGLNPGIRYALSSNEYDTFQKLVDKAFTVERERKVLEVDRKRKIGFSGSVF